MFQVTVWVITVILNMPAQIGELPKKGEVQVVFDSQGECKESPKRDMVLASIVAPYGSSVIECQPIVITKMAKP